MSRRTILLVTLGSLGDLLPFLTVGKALLHRGHEVILATHDEYEGVSRMLGLQFCGIWDGRKSQAAFRDILTSSPEQIWKQVWNEYFVPAMHPTYCAVKNLIQTRRCTVVATWSAIGARLACEKEGVPFCSVYLSPYALSCAVSRDGLRGEPTRLPDEPHGDSPDGRGRHIAFFPDWFGSSEPGWPAGIETTGFPLHDDALMPVSLATLRRFLDAGDPPVVFTPGSFMDQATSFFVDALEACNMLGKRAVFLTPHRRQVPAELPNSVLHMDYVPLHRVLGGAAALVHHGGIGTCAQAMRAGVPQIVAPVFFDQFDNADRVERLGTGLRLDRKSLRVSAMAEAITKSLDEVAQQGRHAEVRALFASEDPPDTICDLIEGWG